MQRFSKSILAAALVLLALFGCASPELRAMRQHVTIADPVLAGQLRMETMHQGLAGNLLKAQVALRSTSPRALNAQYRFSWYDGQGLEVDPEGNSWKPVFFSPKETKNLQGVAPNPGVKDFRIHVKPM